MSDTPETDRKSPSQEGERAEAAPSGQPPVLEAEVVSEEAPRPRSKPEPRPTPADKAGMGLLGKLGWWAAFLLAAFIGGVIAEPHITPGLERLGLIPARDGAARSDDTRGGAADLALLETRLAALETRMDAVSEQVSDAVSEAVSGQSAAGSFAAPDFALLEARLAALEASNAGSGAANSSDTAGAPGQIGIWQEAASERAAQASDIEDLARAVTALSRRLDTLGDATAGRATPAAAKDVAALDAQARALSEQVAAMEQQFDQLSRAVQSQASKAVSRSRAGRLVLLATAARSKALAGEDFTADLAAMSADLAALPDVQQARLVPVVDALVALSETSVPSYTQLVADFGPAATAALEARDKAEGRFLAGLLTTRKRSAEAGGVDAILNQAEARLVARDMAGATEALLALEGQTGAAFDLWRAAATRHVSANAGFDRLIALLAKGTEG